MRAIVDLFLDRLAAQGDTSQLFVHYPSQGDSRAKILCRATRRVRLGGDAKVALFAPALAERWKVDLVWRPGFVFDGQRAALDKLDEPAPGAVASLFRHDVFVFDQMVLFVASRALCHRRSRKGIHLAGVRLPPFDASAL